MESQLDVLFRVVDRLDAARVPYMITGSIALNFYAEPRMTRDVDIVIELESSQADEFAAAFADEFYCEVHAVRRAVQHRKMFNIIQGELGAATARSQGHAGVRLSLEPSARRGE